MPFQRMQNTVLMDAEPRSNGCTIPFQRMPNQYSKLPLKPYQYSITGFLKNATNHFLIYSNQVSLRFRFLRKRLIFSCRSFNPLAATQSKNQSAKRIDLAVPERLSGRPSAVQTFGRNYFSRKSSRFLLNKLFSELISTMCPCRPHPVYVWSGNLSVCRCRNSGQIKVAVQRATHLNLSPRCDDLAGEASLSSYIDALVPASLRSEVLLNLNGKLKTNSSSNLNYAVCGRCIF